MYMRKINLLLLFLSISAGLFSQAALPGIEEVLQMDSDVKVSLLSGEGLSLFYNQDIELELIPQSVFTQKAVATINSLEPNMAVEGLYFIPQENPRQDEMLYVLNTLCSVSTLEGTEYYSQSRKEMRLLFEESWVVDNFEDRNVLEDPYFENLPFMVDLNIFQTDLSFGSNDSTMQIWSDPQGILIEQENRTAMKKNGFIKVIDPGNFKTILLVIPCEEGWLYYGVMAARTLNVKALIDRANESLYNRMNALFNWFLEEYEKD